jgi:hypothetical protein
MIARFSVALLALITAGQPCATAREAQEKPAPKQATIAPEQFDSLVQLIRPDVQRGETKWLEVAWMTNTFEARKKAAAEDKPIVVWTMSACPLGGD